MWSQTVEPPLGPTQWPLAKNRGPIQHPAIGSHTWDLVQALPGPQERTSGDTDSGILQPLACHQPDFWVTFPAPSSPPWPEGAGKEWDREGRPRPRGTKSALATRDQSRATVRGLADGPRTPFSCPGTASQGHHRLAS